MDTHVVLDTRLVLAVLRYLLFTVTRQSAILRVLIDILLTVDHGDFNLPHRAPSLLTLKHRQKCIY